MNKKKEKRRLRAQEYLQAQLADLKKVRAAKNEEKNDVLDQQIKRITKELTNIDFYLKGGNKKQLKNKEVSVILL